MAEKSRMNFAIVFCSPLESGNVEEERSKSFISLFLIYEVAEYAIYLFRAQHTNNSKWMKKKFTICVVATRIFLIPQFAFCE